MPQADVDDLADEPEKLSAASAAARARPWFGRTVISPNGQAPCVGNFGIGSCAATPLPVKRGDLNGGGSPDIVVGASAYKYDETTNPACDDTAAADVCIRSGRTYMYKGEDIVGTSPDAALSTPEWNIKNPFAQADNPETRVVNQLELFGHSVAPVGDVGKCNSAPTAAGFCPAAQINGVPDGKPEVLVAAPRVDYPIDGPDTSRTSTSESISCSTARPARSCRPTATPIPRRVRSSASRCRISPRSATSAGRRSPTSSSRRPVRTPPSSAPRASASR